MKSFKDKNGKIWTIELNVGTIKKVRSECNVDLINVINVNSNGSADTSVLERIASDPCLLVSIVCALCRTQMEKDNIDDSSFAELFSADAVEEASSALIEEIINFSQPAKRKVLTKIYQTAQRFAAATENKVNALINDPNLDKELESQLMKLSGATPESSE